MASLRAVVATLPFLGVLAVAAAACKALAEKQQATPADEVLLVAVRRASLVG